MQPAILSGFFPDLDRGNTDAALAQISEETGNTISPSEYNTLTELADGILNGNSQAVVLNGGYMDVLAQMDGYSDFSSKVREIAVCRVESSVERENRSRLLIQKIPRSRRKRTVFLLKQATMCILSISVESTQEER